MIVVYMVAGMSSRFGGKTKQLAKVGPNNETLIEYSVNQALTCNFNKIIFITNKNTEKSFIDIFGNSYKNIPVEYIEQKYDRTKRTRPWGTTGAICSINGKINEPFILLNGDDIYGVNTFKEGYKLLKESNCNIIGGCKIIDTMPEKGEVNRGVISVKDNFVVGMKEILKISKEKNPELLDSLGNVNFLGFLPETLTHLNKILLKFQEIHKDDPKIECLLTDDLNYLITNGDIVMKYFTIKNKILGLTNPDDEEILKKKLTQL